MSDQIIELQNSKMSILLQLSLRFLLHYEKRMKIAILGTRGIPNNYGGFEQCAEYLSIGLAEKGHKVSIYGVK